MGIEETSRRGDSEGRGRVGDRIRGREESKKGKKQLERGKVKKG